MQNSPLMAESVLFAKQPIYDAESNLYGYEILYRNDEVNQARFTDSSRATLELLVNYCSGIVDQGSSPYVKIFINLTRDLLMSDLFLPLPKERLVIELLEELVVDDDLLVRISDLRQQGFSFALDDFDVGGQLQVLIPLVDYVKLDVLNLEQAEIERRYKLLYNETKQYKHTITILAEKVDNYVTQSICAELGFELFQGYFLAQPAMVYGKKVEMASQSALRLIAALHQSDITIDKACELISQEIKLSYIILKVVNSPLCRLPRKVESIHEGVVYLGLKQVRQWAMILAMSKESSSPREVFRLLLERAKTCENLAGKRNNIDPNICFTIGLFSGIDLVLGADKAWLLERAGLSGAVCRAILNYEGEYGQLLKEVIQFEKIELNQLPESAFEKFSNFSEENLKAQIWGEKILAEIKNVG